MSPRESRLYVSGSVAGLVPIDVATGGSLSEARTFSPPASFRRMPGDHLREHTDLAVMSQLPG